MKTNNTVDQIRKKLLQHTHAGKIIRADETREKEKQFDDGRKVWRRCEGKGKNVLIF